MIHETIKLLDGSDATLTSYVHVDSESTVHAPRAAILICPGGGYKNLSGREGEPIALKFLAAGFNCFVLKYSVFENAKDYAPLIEASYAVKYIRENAARFNCDPDKVFSCGFSAGGHLAGWIGSCWNDPHIPAHLRGINRPNGMILCYPVITGGEFAHVGSFKHLTGKDEPTMEEREAFSLNRLVSENTCPAFIWHTFTDGTVPVENSLLMAEAMRANGIPFELHIFPEGPHGLSLANAETATVNPKSINPHTEVWADLAISWVKTF